VHISIANLASTATAEDLRQLFEPYGMVNTIQIIMDRDTGRCKGFGFVEMPDSHAAHAAIVGLRGQEFVGRTLTVHEAKGRAPHRAPR
jgi:RNA recognition motif-containing protein